MNLVDTHSHLYAEEFDNDRDRVITDSFKLGINSIYLPNVDSASIDSMLSLEEKYPNNFHAMMGLHPCSVRSDFEEELRVVERWLSKRKFVAVGEIGMDLYWDKSYLEEQKFVFKKQIDWALNYSLPIVIHCREAFEEIMEILTSYSHLPKGIFHCFSGTLEQANRVLELKNFKLGIGGVLTFKNSGLDKVVEKLDLEHLVLETDSPYLAPVPHRGKRNESAFIFIVAKKLAELKNISMEQVAEITTANADFIFKNCR